MEFIGAFFLGLATWPILTGAVLLAFLVFALFFEKEGWATAIMLLFGAGVLYFSWGSIDLMTLLLWAGVYIVVGMLYTVPQYVSFSKKRSRRWKKFLSEWTPSGHLEHQYYVVDMAINKGYFSGVNFSKSEKKAKYDALDQQVKDSIEQMWLEDCDKAQMEGWNKFHSSGFLKVRLSNQAYPKWEVYHDKPGLIAQMLLWMVYWPAYLILLVVDDLLTHLVEWLVEKLGGWFTRISNQHFNAA